LATQTLTFLFTDIEGSTALLRRLGGAYAEVLTAHRRLIRAGLAAHGGKEIDTQGDAFFAVFTSPSACAAAAIEMQRALVSRPAIRGPAARSAGPVGGCRADRPPRPLPGSRGSGGSTARDT
jgi:class 3 adenylate cyclase